VLGRVEKQPSLSLQRSGEPPAFLAGWPLAARANFSDIMTQQGKEYWKNLAQSANKLLEKVCPNATQKERDRFISELETDKKRMGHLRKQRAKEGRSMGDTLKDWFRAWASDQPKRANATSAGASARPRDAQEDEEGWTTHSARKAHKGAQPAPRGASTALGAASSTRRRLRGLIRMILLMR
jgi:hypothetical protein